MLDTPRTANVARTARDYFYRAIAMFEEMKAVPDIARTKAALESLD
jgi:hypothetical protein